MPNKTLNWWTRLWRRWWKTDNVISQFNVKVTFSVLAVVTQAMTAVFSSSTDKPLCGGQDPMSKDAPWREYSIDVLDLSGRSHNALRRVRINTLGLLSDSLYTEQFSNIPNVGVKTQSEISGKLQAYLASFLDRDIEPTVQKVTSSEVTEPKLSEVSSSDQHLPNLPTGDKLPYDTTTELCPAWHFYSILLLDLSPRLRHTLEREGYTTLKYLALLAEEADPVDAHISGFGWKSFIEMKEKLKAYLAGLPESAFELVEPAKFGSKIGRAPVDEAMDIPLSDRIAEWLSLLSDRNYQVISWRYGFTGESLTLDVVGEKLGLTRERIRQIECKTIRQLKHPKYDDLVVSIMTIIAPAFEQSGSIMSDDEVTELATQFAPEGINGLGLMRLLSETWKEFTRYNRAEVWVGGDKSELLLDTQAQVLETLRAARAPIDQVTLLDRLRESDFYHHHDLELTETFLRACLRTHPNIEHREDGLLGLKVWAKHRLDDIILALRQIGQPAHYSEITEVVNKLLTEDMQAEAHNIHAQMQRYPDTFVRVGQGTYGLAEWGLETAEFYPDIIERVFCESGHPLSLQQVLSMVCEQRDCKESTVAMLLQFNDRFRPFPGGVYGLAEWHDDEFPDPSYREKRLVAAIADGEVRNKRKPKREIAQAMQDIDDLISLARSNRSYQN